MYLAHQPKWGRFSRCASIQKHAFRAAFILCMLSDAPRVQKVNKFKNCTTQNKVCIGFLRMIFPVTLVSIGEGGSGPLFSGIWSYFLRFFELWPKGGVFARGYSKVLGTF
jgi:hypothetical protein